VVELGNVAENSWPSVSGWRLGKWVRPILDDGGEGGGLGLQRVAQLQDGGDELLDHRCVAATLMAVGKTSFDGLAAVDVVVRVHEARFAALAAQDLGGAIRQHLRSCFMLVSRAAAGLPHGQRELAGMRALDHLVGGADDGGALPGVELAEVLV